MKDEERYHPESVLHPQYFQIGKIPIKVEKMTTKNVDEVHNMLRLSMRKGKILYCSKDAFRRLISCMRVFTMQDTIVAVVGVIHYSSEYSELVRLLVTPQASSKESAGLKKHVINIAKVIARGSSKYVFACGVGEGNKKFFLSHRFRSCSRDDVPSEKWVDYPLERPSWVVRLELDSKHTKVKVKTRGDLS